MATEAFYVMHTKGQTVHFRIMNPISLAVYDFNVDIWAANFAAASDPTLPTSEDTDFGDGTNSLYRATMNFMKLNSTNEAKEYIVQSVDEDDSDAIVGTTTFYVQAGKRVPGL